MKQFDELGREIPDPTPVAHPAQFTRVHNLMSQLQTFIQQELSRQAEARGDETEEEANDFDIDDDEDTWSAYEEEDYKLSFPAEQKADAEGTAPGGATPPPEAPPPDGSAEASKT